MKQQFKFSVTIQFVVSAKSQEQATEIAGFLADDMESDAGACDNCSSPVLVDLSLVERVK